MLCAIQVTVIPMAVGSELGELQFRYFPNMPGSSTCHVQEKEDIQGDMMRDLGMFDGARIAFVHNCQPSHERS